MARLLSLTLVLLCCGTAAADATVPRDFVGIVDSHDPSPEELERMSEAVALVRSNLYWPAVEQFEPGVRDWSRYDALIGGAALSGLRVMPTIYGSTDWGAASPEHPPDAAHRDEFARFLEAAVDRYGRGGEFWSAHPELPEMPVHSWEIWNEPNNPTFWLPDPTAAQYRRLLAVSAPAIHRADPEGEVVLGGLFPTAYSARGIALPRYLNSLYEQGAASDFDAVAVHPYGRDPGAALETVRLARRIMNARGDAEKPIWITEIGWATSGERSTVTVSEETQAAYLRELIATAAARRSRLGLAGVFWFYRQDRASYDWASRTGLLRRDGSEKPAWRALGALTDDPRRPWSEMLTISVRQLSDSLAIAARRLAGRFPGG